MWNSRNGPRDSPSTASKRIAQKGQHEPTKHHSNPQNHRRRSDHFYFQGSAVSLSQSPRLLENGKVDGVYPCGHHQSNLPVESRVLRVLSRSRDKVTHAGEEIEAESQHPPWQQSMQSGE